MYRSTTEPLSASSVCFSPKVWLLWIAVAIVNTGLLNAANNLLGLLTTQEHGHGAAAGLGIASLAIDILLLPIFATNEWLVLRAAFRRLRWSRWAVVYLVFGFHTFATLVILFETRGGAVPTLVVALLGCVPAIFAAIALGYPLRTRKFFVLTFAFWASTELTLLCVVLILTRRGELLLLRGISSHFSLSSDRQAQAAIASFIVHAATYALGAAITGFGLWIVGPPDLPRSQQRPPGAHAVA